MVGSLLRDANEPEVLPSSCGFDDVAIGGDHVVSVYIFSVFAYARATSLASPAPGQHLSAASRWPTMRGAARDDANGRVFGVTYFD